MTIHSFMSYITYLPSHIDAQDLPVPAKFEFVLSNEDYNLLVKLSYTKGGAIAEFFEALEVVTSDSQGVETNCRPIAVNDSDYFRCRISVVDFVRTDLQPAAFNEHLGETRLIPIVYDMVHFIHPQQPGNLAREA